MEQHRPESMNQRVRGQLVHRDVRERVRVADPFRRRAFERRRRAGRSCRTANAVLPQRVDW